MVFETMLSLPSMDETIKLSSGIKRKHVLLLSLVIEKGIAAESPEISNLLTAMGQEASADLIKLSQDYLEKAGLTALSQNLKSYNTAGDGK